MFDADDTPGYLHDAYRAALDNGLLSLNLTRVGTDTRMWQASSRFVKSSGFHVEIKENALDAVMAALGAYTRIGAPAPAGFFDDEPAPEGDPREDMTLADRTDPREPSFIEDIKGDDPEADASGLFD